MNMHKSFVVLAALALSVTAHAAPAEPDTTATRTAVANKIVKLTVNPEAIRKDLDSALLEVPYIQRVAVSAELKKVTPEFIRGVFVKTLTTRFTTKELDVLLMSETHKAELKSAPEKLEGYREAVDKVFKEELMRAFTASQESGLSAP